ncbi:MAG: 3-isopropylmalate dehydratase small subunit [Oscillospiraceae bacterium]|nr:3-isopropylmalate dehydratase small subunit [Oscillospiraceae bacterium]
MKKVKIIRSPAAPWLIPNIDTDIILPMSRLVSNYDETDHYAFEPYRYSDSEGKVENPEFPLNMPAYRDAKIMLCGHNFGCGSSREEATCALADMGIECFIASSFGSIFLRNCYQKGLLPVILPAETVEILAELAPGGEFEVNLETLTITAPNGDTVFFEIDPMRREMLLEGMDDVGHTLKQKVLIDGFYEKDKTARPWVYI